MVAWRARCPMTSGARRRCRLLEGHTGDHLMIWDKYYFFPDGRWRRPPDEEST